MKDINSANEVSTCTFNCSHTFNLLNNKFVPYFSKLFEFCKSYEFFCLDIVLCFSSGSLQSFIIKHKGSK